jgi:hypothetical protein
LPRKIFLFRDVAGLPLARQFELARRHGAREDDFSGRSGRAFVDAARPGGETGDSAFAELVARSRARCVVYLAGPLVLGPGAAEQLSRADAIGRTGAALFDMMPEGGDGEAVDSFPATAAFLVRGKREAARAAVALMQAGKRRSGARGGKRPEFSDGEIARLEPLWRAAATKADFLARAEAEVGRKVSYTSSFRWAGERGWGPRGGGSAGGRPA